MTWTHWLYNVPLWSWKMESILGTWIWYDASLRHYRLWSCLPWVVMECVVIQWRCRNTSVPLRVLIPNSTVTQAVLISGVITWVGWRIVIFIGNTIVIIWTVGRLNCAAHPIILLRPPRILVPNSTVNQAVLIWWSDLRVCDDVLWFLLNYGECSQRLNCAAHFIYG